MDKALVLILTTVGCVVLLNLLATFALIRDDYPTRLQRILQTGIIWLVPVVGALVVLGVIASHRDAADGKSLLLAPFLATPIEKPGSGSGVQGYCGGSHGAEGGCGGD